MRLKVRIENLFIMKISNHQPTYREVYSESYGIFHSDARNEKREIMNSVGFVGPPPMHPHKLHQILSVMRIFNFEITITIVSENHCIYKYCDI